MKKTQQRQFQIDFTLDAGSKEITWLSSPTAFFGFAESEMLQFETLSQFETLCMFHSDTTISDAIENCDSAVSHIADTGLHFSLRPPFDRRESDCDYKLVFRKLTNTDSTPLIHAHISPLSAIEPLIVTQRHQTSNPEFLHEFDNTHVTDLIGRLLSAQELSSPDNSQFMLFGLSVDRLDKINEVFGYDTANDAIVSISSRLRKYLRKDDYIGHITSNLIVAIISLPKGEPLEDLGYRLITSIRPHAIETRAGQLMTTVSAGLLPLGIYTQDLDETLCCLHDALLDARKAPGNNVVVYDRHVERQSARNSNLSLANRIVSALNERRFELVTTPVVDAASEQEIYFSTRLIANADEDGKDQIFFGQLHKIASQLGLSSLIDQMALQLALERLAADETVILCVQIAHSSLMDPHLMEAIAGFAGVHEEPVQRLIVVITEDGIYQNLDMTIKFISQLKGFGIKVGLSDFGAGNLPFTLLSKLNLDLIQIDGSFGINLSKNTENLAFVEFMSKLAHALDMDVVLSWVSSREDADLAKTVGVDFMYGPLFESADDNIIDADATEQDRFEHYNGLYLVKE